ncbi:MAG: hypothetical protein ACOVOV_07275, partial [Dolichospermum sp.]
LNGAGGVTLGANTEVTGTLDLSTGTLTVGANTLTISGNNPTRNTGSINATNSSSTVAFTNGSAITLPGGIFGGTLRNLTLNGAGGVTLGANTEVTGTLALTNGTLTVGGNTLTLAGTVSGSGTINATASSSIVALTGSSITTLPSQLGTTINGLTINNGQTVSMGSSDVIIGGNGGSLTLTSGKFSIGTSRTLTLAGTVSMNASNNLIGSSTSNLAIQGSTLKTVFFDNTTAGSTNALQDLTLSSSGNVEIGSNTTANANNQAQLYVHRTVTVGTGTTLNINNAVDKNHIILVSDGTNQARVANVQGSITQGDNTKIVVERFVNLTGGNNRAWRFVTAPLRGTGNVGSPIDRTVRFQ